MCPRKAVKDWNNITENDYQRYCGEYNEYLKQQCQALFLNGNEDDINCCKRVLARQNQCIVCES